jgi:transposase InsO family protein
MVEEMTSTAFEYNGSATSANAAAPQPAALPAGALARFRHELAEAERDHVERLREHSRLQSQDTLRRSSRRRARAYRQRRPRLQQAVRAQAVRTCRQLRSAGCSFAEAAQRLNLRLRTLRSWIQRQAGTSPAAPALGRPPRLAAPAQRNTVVGFLKEEGPTVGLPSLRQQFPELARDALVDLKRRYRHVWRRRHPELLRVLHWQKPGRVWAMDFAEPSLVGASRSLPPIDGSYPYLLAIRDLASGYTLCWLPVRQATAEVAQGVLHDLFALHGAPLVLKTDNGSHFRADALDRLLGSAGVEQLFSPPYWPRYNGAIEASIGSLKSRTEAQAAAQGRPGQWIRFDANAARLEANARIDPKSVRAPTPAETWACRTPVDLAERARFQEAVADERRRVRQDKAIASDEDLDHWDASAVDREVLQRVLVGHAYLLFRRRRIPARI